MIRNLRNGGRCGIVLDEGLLFRTNEDAFVKTKRKLLDDCDVWCILSLPAGVFTAAGAGVKTNLIFFTKGNRTKKIWYYDLSEVKVRKKTPLTLKHFDEFLKLLPNKSDSELSWTIDMEDRKKKAAEEAKPFKEIATKKQHKAVQLNERLKELNRSKNEIEREIKKAEPLKEKLDQLQIDKSKIEKDIEQVQQQYKSILSEAREAAAKAKEIEDAVYDLKAVNPNKKPDIDTRTPEELLDIIEAKGREIAEALAVLRRL